MEGAQLVDAYSAEKRLLTLQRTTIRGVESAGMICSEKELGLSDHHETVLILDPDAPVGQPLQDVLGDTILEVELTPNLAHVNCIVGLAREIAALTGQPLRPWRPQDPACTQHAGSADIVCHRRQRQSATVCTLLGGVD